MVRLYYTEPWLRVFDARVVAAEPHGSQWRVRLDRTAFYPTSGGQPFDTGRLNDVRVVEVAADDHDEVVHIVDAPLAAGDAVAGSIDWARRADHMQQHTGQHILSAAFEHLDQVRTQSFHLGAESSTIDLAREVSRAEITGAEDDANRIVWEGRPVSIRFVSKEEAARLPLRKEPVKEGRLRLIEIEGYDLSACGGTHVSRTGEVGLIAVKGWERFRGGTRLEFVCGVRALASYRSWRDAASGAGRLLSATPSDLPAAVERLQQDVKDARRELKVIAEKSAGLEAGTLADRATKVEGVATLVEAMEGYDANNLKLLAASFIRERGRAVVLFTASSPAQVVAMRSPDVTGVDASAIVTTLCGEFGGRGGGKPESAQGGGLNATPDTLTARAGRILRETLRGSATEN